MVNAILKPKMRFDSVVFSRHYAGGVISRTIWGRIPADAISHFEGKSRRFILPEKYRPGDFEGAFMIRHGNGDVTFVAQQFRTFKPGSGDTEHLTYFIDMRKRELIGHSELRNVFSSPIKYFKNKPLVGFNSSYEDYRGKGLGTRRVFYMNAFSRMCYQLPLYSDTVLSESAANIWKALVKKRLARKFTETTHERYVIINTRKPL